MESCALLVIGAGPAGFAAARGFRRAGGTGAVVMVTDEGRMPYERPPLTKELLRGEIDEDDLPMEEETWLAEHGVRLVAGHSVRVDPEVREVELSGGRGLRYHRCVLATGAEPVRLPVPGADDPAVHVVRSLDHVRELQARLRAGDPVVIVGSGFIGCEIAASLRMRGHPVSLISTESAPNVGRIGERAAGQITTWLAAAGVTLAFGEQVDHIARAEGRLMVAGETTTLEGAVVVMATGVTPRGELAGDCGIALHEGAVPVDSAMRTSIDGLLAAGDVAFAFNTSAGRALRVEHWGDALGQGETAGQTAAGMDVAWHAVPGFWSSIGSHTLKYAAWGDGYDDLSMDGPAEDGSFSVWYSRGGQVVGVLTHDRDSDYKRGRDLIAVGAPWPL